MRRGIESLRSGRLIAAWVMALLAGLLLWPVPGRAESDYEFAQGLLKLNKPRSFATEELVERLAKKLAASPKKNLQLEAKLVTALLRRKQARYASAEKRDKLLTEADALYKEFLAQGKDHRLFKVGQGAAATIQSDYARALLKAAQENPQLAAENRRKAVGILQKIADLRLANAQKFRPPLKKALKAIEAWYGKHPEAEHPPGSLITPAQKALVAYVPKDKRYVIARMQQVDAYAENDPQKKEAAHALVKYCEKIIESEDIGQLDDVCMWYWFIKGRLHSMVLEEDKATESWKSALDIQIEKFPPAVKKTVFMIKKLIYRDVVKMKMRAGKRGDKDKYADVVDIVGNALYEPTMKSFFDEPAGKDLLIDYAKALVLQPEAGSGEYEQAIKALRKIVEKGPPWSNNAARAMADIMRLARARHKRPNLTADQWYDTAHGFYIEGSREYLKYYENKDSDAGKAKQHFEKARAQFDQAVEYFRRCIGRARKPAFTDAVTRLRVEPKAWVEMGLAYYKMQQYYEAIIAYQALRTTFGKKYRARWLPDPKKNKRLYRSKSLQKALADLDRKNDANPREDGVLNRVQKNIVIALNKQAKSGNRWDKALKVRIISDEGVGAIKIGSTDIDYQAGKLSMEAAKDLKAQGKDFTKEKKVRDADKQYLQALAKLEEAAGRFARVAPSSKAYEVALYQVATCYTLAQQVLATGRIKKALKAEQVEARIKELTQKGLAAYKKYEEHVTKEPDNTEEGQARRKKLARGVLLSRGTLYYGIKDWEAVIKACDQYLAYEKENPAPAGGAKLRSVYFNKFRAYSHLADTHQPPESDKYLEQAEKLIPILAKSKKTVYLYALNNVSQRYYNSVARAEKAKLGKDLLAKYNGKIAEYQALVLKEKPEKERTLEEYGRLLYYNEKTGKLQAAADIAAAILTRFDPKNENRRMGTGKEKEERAFWAQFLKAMNGIYRFDDINKWQRCQKDHATLVDYLFETREGVANEDNKKMRPADDKHNIDYDKALDQIKSIKKNYPNCSTFKPTQPGQYLNGKSYLQTIQDEIDYRRQIIATRDLLSDIALKVAADFSKQGKEVQAQKYRRMAGEQIAELLKLYGNVPSMKLKLANIKIANKDYDGALEVLGKVKEEEPDHSSELYVNTSKRISEVYFMQGDFQSAVGYPQFIAATAGLDSNWVKKYWPDMKKFMDKCYAKGAKRPKTKKLVVAGLDYEPKTPDEKEFVQLQLVNQTGEQAKGMSKDILNKQFVFKYNFLKDKIAHFKEYEKLERLVLHHRGTADEKEVLTEAVMKRHEVIKDLVGAESKYWAAYKKYDWAYTTMQGKGKKLEELARKKEQLLKKVNDLKAKLPALGAPSKTQSGQPKTESGKAEKKKTQ